jgi:NADH-quinone oxidoreductase subunit G
MRMLPRNHDGVNEEWISDKTRFVWDGLRRQRLDRPYIRENGKLRPAGWGEALKLAGEKLKGAKRPAGLVGDLAPVEAAFALRQLMESLGGVAECRVDGAKLPAGNRAGYAGTAAIEDIDGARRILLIGTDPRSEAPVLNARIRKAWTRGAEVSLVGEAVDLTYDYHHLGRGGPDLARVAKDRGNWPGPEEGPALVIVGQAALRRADGEAVLAAAMQIAEGAGAGLLILQTAAGRVGAMDAGATCDGGIDAALKSDVIWALGVDETDIPEGPFVIYQGSHGDRGAHRADLILPGAAWTEEQALFVNTEGRPQLALRAGFPPGEAKENWAILRAVSAEAGAQLPYDSIAQLRQQLVREAPFLAEMDQVARNDWHPLPPGELSEGPFGRAVHDFYLTNPIARASEVMAELSARAQARAVEKIAAQ